MKAYKYIITGNYINFAVCEYYNDNIFAVLSELTMTSIVLGVDYENELKTFTKLHLEAFSVVSLFFQKHIELMFLKFDPQLIQKVLDFAIKGLGEAQNYEL